MCNEKETMYNLLATKCFKKQVGVYFVDYVFAAWKDAVYVYMSLICRFWKT